MFSIVIPLYNKEQWISDTLRSVLSQTFSDFEVVVVDDGSTDNSISVIKSFNDPRVRIITQKNAGVAAARNHGIEEAKGEYIALIDADDQWEPNFLETMNNLILKYPECDVLASTYKFKDQDGNITFPKTNNMHIAENEDGIVDNYFEIFCCSTPPIWTSATIIKKEAIQSIGGFPLGVRLGEDLITWAKLACKYKIAYTRKALSTYVFDSQDKRVVPTIQPNRNDYVGEQFKILCDSYDIPFLKKSAAMWHKMRMVTFVRLNRRSEARKEYAKIRSYVTPGKKDKIWLFLSYTPYSFIKFVVKHKDRFNN